MVKLFKLCPAGEGVTTIEGMAKFDSEGMTIGDTVVNDGKITVGAAGNQTVIEGGAITTNTINAGGTIIDYVGMTVGSTVVNDSKITVGAADDQTIIEGGAINAKSLVLGTKDVGATIAGIERDPENKVTTIEGVTSFDSDGMSIKDVDGFGTSLDKTGMSITANGGSINLSTKLTAGFASFSNNGEYDTVISGGRIETGSLKIGDVEFSEWKNKVDNRLDDLEGKTQNIKPGTGAGTGTGEGGTAVGEGNNILDDVPATGEGHTGINGDVTVGGEINAGEIVVGDKDSDNKTTINGGNITTGNTTIDGDGINTGNGNFTGEITAGTGNIGGVGMEEGTITTGETTIDGDGINTGNGNFTGNITADTGNIGDIVMKEDTINTGNTTINGSGMTVGTGENGTSITGEGITVGDKNGVSIKNDEVRVGGGEDGKGGSYMNDTDVVTGEGVSLNQTAERVGHLENRVGELEDRIDKVGAMSAAIANLRTMGYDPAAPTEIAVGVGQYRSETGVALGMFHYPNKDFMLSLSVSTSGDEVMGGIGATWKFGRKSPEKVLAAEKEKAAKAKLAKAEAMKKAAKEAKIKAQQERHAKLAAERAAQAEAAK